MSQTDGASPDPTGPRPRPTMRDVAALARVSLKTVSRVINGESTVAPELAARVHRAATTLDYRPNLTARSLRSSDGRTRSIGLVLENVANPFSSALHRAVEDIARSRGVAVFAGSVDEDPERERELALALISRRVDGLIIVPAGDDQSYLANEQRAGLSLVFADRPPRLLRADAVVSDNAGGAQSRCTTPDRGRSSADRLPRRPKADRDRRRPLRRVHPSALGLGNRVRRRTRPVGPPRH